MFCSDAETQFLNTIGINLMRQRDKMDAFYMAIKNYPKLAPVDVFTWTYSVVIF
jgi:hypothetical protein